MVQLATQPQTGNSTFATGADVSRFQRRTVPGKPAEALPVGGVPGGAPAPGAGGYPGAAMAKGPVVHVVRGNVVTDVSVGGNN